MEKFIVIHQFERIPGAPHELQSTKWSCCRFICLYSRLIDQKMSFATYFVVDMWAVSQLIGTIALLSSTLLLSPMQHLKVSVLFLVTFLFKMALRWSFTPLFRARDCLRYFFSPFYQTSWSSRLLSASCAYFLLCTQCFNNFSTRSLPSNYRSGCLDPSFVSRLGLSLQCCRKRWNTV